jgi:hypothetical protein
MLYNSTKGKIYKTWVKTNASKEKIIQLENTQTRTIKNYRTLETTYANKPNVYISEWQLMDYFLWVRYEEAYWKYSIGIVTPLLNFPVIQVPFVNANILFKGEEAFIDYLGANVEVIQINKVLISHENSIPESILSDSYNMNLFTGIEFIQQEAGFEGPRQLWAKVIVSINKG